jgi:methionyl-tRNA formyltransferase
MVPIGTKYEKTGNNMNKLNLAFFGSSNFVVPIASSMLFNNGRSLGDVANEQFEKLTDKANLAGFDTKLFYDESLNLEINFDFVITQPDRENRGKIISNPVSTFATKNNISKFTPEKLNDNVEEIKKLYTDLDMAIVASYGQIIADDVVNMAKYGMINWHPSLLPKYRGPTPIQTALFKGDTHTGLSWINVASKMDAGEILLQTQKEVLVSDNFETIAGELGKVGANTWAIAAALKILWKNGKFEPVVQDEKSAIICKMLKKEDKFLDLKEASAQEVLNHNKAYHIFPGTWIKSKFFDDNVKLVEVGAVQEYAPNKSAEWQKVENTALLKTANGWLQVHKITLEKGKTLNLKGYEFTK